MTNKHPWLITIDLDGTLLKSSRGIHPNTEFNDYNLKIIEKALKKGHKVAIVTGRPWRDTEKIYEALGLKTIVANYNGASIHHPHDELFSPINFGINRRLFKQLINETRLGEAMTNFVIEGPTKTHVLDLKDKDMLEQFHIHEGANVHQCTKDIEFDENPQSFIFRIDETKVEKNELITELRRKFGEAFLFRFWLHPEKNMVNIEANAKSVSKGTAIKFIASYYNIPMFRTIAFGDGENDIEMLHVASLGVAMKNASDLVKSHANDITDFTNDDAGVGKYLENFFNLNK